MSMSRKDFVVVAEAIKEVHNLRSLNACERELVGVVAKSVATGCAKTNPNFDRARFLIACGVAP